MKIQMTMAEWIKKKTEHINQRTFNINEIFGVFERDWSGKIVNRDNILRKNYFRDLNGSVVNEMGYLIKEDTGDILSKYTFDVVFKQNQLIGKSHQEIPLPYYMEQYNFRPMQCFGNFDYDAKGKPQILKDKFGQNIDNNLRRVNASGWLIDQFENIIDIFGKVKFIKEQLNEKGEIPKMFNYEGKEYKVKSILGQFNMHKYTKEIIMHSEGDRHYDNLMRKVNNKGYLIDEWNNIVDKKGYIIWRRQEMMDNEPPKLFPFTEFSLTWIMGEFERDVNLSIKQKSEFDINGRRINQFGYLVDEEGNVIDVYNGNILFKKEILNQTPDFEGDIPYIFRSGKLKVPPMTMTNVEEQKPQKKKAKSKPLVDQEMDIDEEEIFKELEKLDFGLMT